MSALNRRPALLLLALCCLPPPALAQEAVETIPVESASAEKASSEPVRDDENVTYSGIGLSRVSTDFDNLKEAVNLDGVLGIRVPNVNWVAAEINLGFTLIPGENEGGDGGLLGGGGGGGGTPCTIDNPPTPPGCTPSDQQGGEPQVSRSSDDFQMQMIGAYLVLRSPGRFYGMAKIGYGYQRTTIQEIDDRERSGTVYSGGLGYRYGSGLGGVELVYHKYLSEIDAIGFNVTYGFGGRRSRDRDRDD